jgi:hypothetical protein
MHRVLIGKLEGRTAYGRTTQRYDNIKTDFHEICQKATEWD